MPLKLAVSKWILTESVNMSFIKSYEEIVGNATESADFYDSEMKRLTIPLD